MQELKCDGNIEKTHTWNGVVYIQHVWVYKILHITLFTMFADFDFGDYSRDEVHNNLWQSSY